MAGCKLKHPIQRNSGYNLFELDGGRILVAAFESLQGNDCFSFKGGIDGTAIANAALRVRDDGGPHNLRVAVWHHGLHSEPSYRSDYVSMISVYDLIGHGFRLGLHGHQHFAEIGSHYVHIPDDRVMAVVSAGSLCAGGNDLPRGINRQYNVVVISDDYAEARVHVREVTRGNHFAASSGATGFANGVAQLRLTDALNDRERESDVERVRNSKLVIEAEGKLRDGRPESALEILEKVGWKDEPYARELFIRAAESSNQWEKVTVILAAPTTADERVKLMEALIQLGRPQEALSKLSDGQGPPLAEHVRREMYERLKRLIAMGEGRQ